MFRGFGIWELLFVLLIVLLIFGPSKLPQLGQAIGKTLREFRDSMAGEEPADDDGEGSADEGGTGGS